MSSSLTLHTNRTKSAPGFTSRSTFLARSLHTSYAKLSSGIPWNMPRVIVFSSYTYSPKLVF